MGLRCVSRKQKSSVVSMSHSVLDNQRRKYTTVTLFVLFLNKTIVRITYNKHTDVLLFYFNVPLMGFESDIHLSVLHKTIVADRCFSSSVISYK